MLVSIILPLVLMSSIQAIVVVKRESLAEGRHKINPNWISSDSISDSIKVGKKIEHSHTPQPGEGKVGEIITPQQGGWKIGKASALQQGRHKINPNWISSDSLSDSIKVGEKFRGGNTPQHGIVKNSTVQKSAQIRVNGTAKQGTENEVNSTVQKVAENGVNSTVLYSAEDGVNNTIIHSAENGVNSTIQKSAENGVKGTVQEIPKNGVNGTLQEGTTNSVNGTVQENAENVVNATVQEIAENNGTVQENAEDVVSGMAQGISENRLNDTVQEIAENGVNSTVQGIAENRVNDTVQEIVENGVNSTVHEIAENGVNGTVQKIVENEVNRTRSTVKEVAENGERSRAEGRRKINPNWISLGSISDSNKLVEKIENGGTLQFGILKDGTSQQGATNGLNGTVQLGAENGVNGTAVQQSVRNGVYVAPQETENGVNGRTVFLSEVLRKKLLAESKSYDCYSCANMVEHVVGDDKGRCISVTEDSTTKCWPDLHGAPHGRGCNVIAGYLEPNASGPVQFVFRTCENIPRGIIPVEKCDDISKIPKFVTKEMSMGSGGKKMFHVRDCYCTTPLCNSVSMALAEGFLR